MRGASSCSWSTRRWTPQLAENCSKLALALSPPLPLSLSLLLSLSLPLSSSLPLSAVLTCSFYSPFSLSPSPSLPLSLSSPPPPLSLSPLKQGKPDPLNSAFRLTYNMALNLLRVEEINPEYMLERSFFLFQNNSSIPSLEKSGLISKLVCERKGLTRKRSG